MTIYKGGQCTRRGRETFMSGGAGIENDYVFRTLPGGRWTRVFLHTGNSFKLRQDRNALEFILERRSLQDRLRVTDAQRILRTRPDIAIVRAYDYVRRTAPEFEQGDTND